MQGLSVDASLRFNIALVTSLTEDLMYHQTRKVMLMDIGTEELSHLEVVGCLARLHLKPSRFDREIGGRLAYTSN
jgi:Mn-containing catalase